MNFKSIAMILILISVGFSLSVINSKTGNWSDSTIWNNSAVPTINDNVTINTTTFVILDTNANIQNITVSGNLTLNASKILNVTGFVINGKLIPLSNSTFNSSGAGIITNLATLGNNTDWIFDQNALLTVAGGGTLNAPNASGAWTVSSTITADTVAIFNNDNGTLTVDGGTLINFLNGANSSVWKFYNINVTGGNLLQMYQGSYTIENSLNVPSGTTIQLQNRDGVSTATVTLGTLTQSANITATGTVQLLAGSGAPAATLTLRAANLSYPWILTGGGFNPDGGTASTKIFENGIFLANVTTNIGTSETYKVSNMTFNGTLNVSSGDIMLVNSNQLLTINGTTIINGSLIPLSNSTINTGITTDASIGAITINSGGLFGNNTNWTLTNNGHLTVNSGGTYNAPNAAGSWTINGGSSFFLNSGGTLNHNNGTVTMNSNFFLNQGSGTAVYNNVLVTQSGAETGSGGITIEGTLTTAGGRILFINSAGATRTVSFGTATSSGVIVNSGAIRFANNGGSSTFTAISPSFPWTWTGSDATWDSESGTVVLQNGVYSMALTTGATTGRTIQVANMTFNSSVTISPGDTLNVSNTNITFVMNVTFNGNQTLNDSYVNAISNFVLNGSSNTTLTNVTLLNITPSVSGTANLTVRWRNIKVLDENGAAISGAVANVTQTGTTVTGTTGSDGAILAIVEDYQNIGGTITLKSVILNGSKSGYLNNAFTDNMTSSERVIVLAPSGGATSGFNNGTAIQGTPLSSTFTPSVKVNGLTIRGPWQGVQNITVLDSSSNVVVNFTHNFTEGGLSLGYLQLERGSGYVGINGGIFSQLSHFNKTFTLNVPVRDALCNTQICIGQARTKATDCLSTDWSTYSSTKSGNFCLATVSGTVVRDQADLTSIVAVPELDFVWVLVIFVIAFGIFRVRSS